MEKGIRVAGPTSIPMKAHGWCNKIGYATRAEAREYARSAKRKGAGNMRAYECADRDCHERGRPWHLTRRPKPGKHKGGRIK